MRAYMFGNYYLSQIQQGIQAFHCITDLIYKYKVDSSMRPKMIDDWAINHKTAILLNGGNQQSLIDLNDFFTTPENPYPFTHFREDTQSLNSSYTCVGIILPEHIYEGAAILRDRRTIISSIGGEFNKIKPFNGVKLEFDYTNWEIDLMTKMNEYRLA